MGRLYQENSIVAMASRNLRDKLESKETIKLGNQTQNESGGQFLWFIVYKSRYFVPGIYLNLPEMKVFVNL